MRDTEPRSEISRQLLAYWNSRRGDREFPGRQDVDPSALTAILPHLLLVNVAYNPLDFAYRLIGTTVVARSARDYTGMRLMELPSQSKPSEIWTLYETAVVERRPAQKRIPYLRIEGKFVEMQALPLASDSATIDMLIGSVTFEQEQLGSNDLPAI